MSSPKASCNPSQPPQLKRSSTSIRFYRSNRLFDELKQSLDNQLIQSTVHSGQAVQEQLNGVNADGDGNCDHNGNDWTENNLAEKQLEYYKEMLQQRTAEVTELRQRLKQKQEELLVKEARVLEMMKEDEVGRLSSQLCEVSEELVRLRGILANNLELESSKQSKTSKSMSQRSASSSSIHEATLIKPQHIEIIPLRLTGPFQPVDGVRTKRVNRVGGGQKKEEMVGESPRMRRDEIEEYSKQEVKRSGEFEMHQRVLEGDQREEVGEVGREGWLYQQQPDDGSQGWGRCQHQQNTEANEVGQSKMYITCSASRQSLDQVTNSQHWVPDQNIHTLLNPQPSYLTVKKPLLTLTSTPILSLTLIPPSKPTTNTTPTSTRPYPTNKPYKHLIQLIIDALNNSLRLILKSQHPQPRQQIEKIKQQIGKFVEEYNPKVKKQNCTEVAVWANLKLRQLLDQTKKIY